MGRIRPDSSTGSRVGFGNRATGSRSTTVRAECSGNRRWIFAFTTRGWASSRASSTWCRPRRWRGEERPEGFGFGLFGRNRAPLSRTSVTRKASTSARASGMRENTATQSHSQGHNQRRSEPPLHFAPPLPKPVSPGSDPCEAPSEVAPPGTRWIRRPWSDRCRRDQSRPRIWAGSSARSGGKDTPQPRHPGRLGHQCSRDSRDRVPLGPGRSPSPRSHRPRPGPAEAPWRSPGFGRRGGAGTPPRSFGWESGPWPQRAWPESPWGGGHSRPPPYPGLPPQSSKRRPTP